MMIPLIQGYHIGKATSKRLQFPAHHEKLLKMN